jgi:hypothetical protein
MKVFLLAALVCVGCACKGSSSGGGTGPGTGTGSGSGSAKPVVGDPATCETIAAHVEDLYRASAERTQMTDGEVADNVAMVLRDCKAAPDRVVACVTKATAVAQLESQCLAPLDDQGSEGEQFK